jgi:enoyl-CoA hydratase
LLTARLMGAEEAYATGLISEIVEPLDVRVRARELAGKIAQNAPMTIWAAKEAVRRLHEHLQSADFTDVIEKSYQSDDFRLGVESFIRKQAPKWSGK